MMTTNRGPCFGFLWGSFPQETHYKGKQKVLRDLFNLWNTNFLKIVKVGDDTCVLDLTVKSFFFYLTSVI